MKMSGYGSLEVADEVEDGELAFWIASQDAWVTKDDAKMLVEHLINAFKLDAKGSL